MADIQQFRRLYVNHTIVGFIDEIAQRHPSKTYVSIPKVKADATKGWEDVSFSTFAQAIDKASWWIMENIGQKRTLSPEGLHFFLPNDLSYLVFVLASIKTGYYAICVHPATSAETHLTVNKAMQCNIIAFSGEFSEKAKILYSANPHMRIIAVPSLRFWLEGHPVQPFPYHRSVHEVKYDIFAVVHSSGTTGIPKAIVMTQGRLKSWAMLHLRSADVAKLNLSNFTGHRVATLVPSMIGVGLFSNLVSNLIFDYTAVLPTTNPLTVGTFVDLIKHAQISGAVMAPTILQDIIKDNAAMDGVRKNMHSIVYTGAPLSEYVGDVLSKCTILSNSYGVSESGPWPSYSSAPEDWEYFDFDSNLKYIFEPIGQIGYHELVLQRKDVNDVLPAVFDLYPSISEWRTGDVFLQHQNANKKHLWRHVGRLDDMVHCETSRILHSEKQLNILAQEPFLPNQMERAICRDDHICGAVICENRRGLLALVIEPAPVKNGQGPTWTNTSPQTIIEAAWSTIELANLICPTAARIEKELVLVANRPLPRGAKGYPQRPFVKKEYSEAIDAAYAELALEHAQH